MQGRSADNNGEYLDLIADDTLALMRRNVPSMLRRHRIRERTFERRLRQRWQRPLDLLVLLISSAFEVAEEFSNASGDQAVNAGNTLVEALIRIHARACQVSREVLVLLLSGYADGANSRWRSLHELWVTSLFLKEHGRDMAERYLLHDVIQRYKLAEAHQQHAGRLGDEALALEKFAALKTARDELIGRFGPSFGRDHGWASTAVEPKAPSFRDIEQSVKLDHWRPHYRIASDNVHANAHRLYYSLGAGNAAAELLLVGPSNMGLADSGHSTAIALSQTTATLLNTLPSRERRLQILVLQKLEQNIGREFLRVHDELVSSAQGDYY